MCDFKSKLKPEKRTWQVVLKYKWGPKSKCRGVSILFADCYTKAAAKYICIKRLNDTVENVKHIRKPIISIVEPEPQFFGYGL